MREFKEEFLAAFFITFAYLGAAVLWILIVIGAEYSVEEISGIHKREQVNKNEYQITCFKKCDSAEIKDELCHLDCRKEAEKYKNMN